MAVFQGLRNYEQSRGICPLLWNFHMFAEFCRNIVGAIRWRRPLLACSAEQATETGSTGQGSHHPASSLCGCGALLFKVWVGPVSTALESVSWQRTVLCSTVRVVSSDLTTVTSSSSHMRTKVTEVTLQTLRLAVLILFKFYWLSSEGCCYLAQSINTVVSLTV